MGSIQKGALAGATGNLGTPNLQALLDAKFDVTVLTRAGSHHKFHSDVRVAAVDYNDIGSLIGASNGQDAIISTISTGEVLQQLNIVDAAIAAGVKRILPSEFGYDMQNPSRSGVTCPGPEG